MGSRLLESRGVKVLGGRGVGTKLIGNAHKFIKKAECCLIDDILLF